jgi:hypothetical protein
MIFCSWVISWSPFRQWAGAVPAVGENPARPPAPLPKTNNVCQFKSWLEHITVCHLPPGTSKWNRIEHRLFSFITQNWRGKPLVSYQTIVQLIGATTTRTGLKVQCAIDDALYPAGVKVSDAEMADLKLTPHAFHGEWNYTIEPRPP